MAGVRGGNDGQSTRLACAKSQKEKVPLLRLLELWIRLCYYNFCIFLIFLHSRWVAFSFARCLLTISCSLILFMNLYSLFSLLLFTLCADDPYNILECTRVAPHRSFDKCSIGILKMSARKRTWWCVFHKAWLNMNMTFSMAIIRICNIRRFLLFRTNLVQMSIGFDLTHFGLNLFWRT